MDFKKFTSIENTYRQKFIDKFIFPEGCEFVAREKLDGANIQLLFTPGKPMKVGKRTAYIEENEDFYDIWNTLNKYKVELDGFQRYCDSLNEPIRIYGEIYGQGVQKRVKYGSEKYIALFDAEIGEKLLTQEEFELFIINFRNINNNPNYETLLPKSYGIFSKLSDALSIDVENMERSGAEGVVIQAYNHNVYNKHGERFIVKKKSNAFEDTRQDAIARGAGRAEPKEGDVIYSLNRKFREYINKNRILDIYAKYGPITEPKQIGDYIKYTLDDAKTDFLKDHDLSILVPDMDKKKEKDLYNVGGIIVNYLKENL